MMAQDKDLKEPQEIMEDLKEGLQNANVGPDTLHTLSLLYYLWDIASSLRKLTSRLS
jgi:hypothetical protein